MGENYCEELGIGNILDQIITVRLNIILDIKSIYYCGITYAITTSGEIYTWGKNILVGKEYIMEPSRFTYFIDIDVKYMNRTKSARKKLIIRIYYNKSLLL